MKEQNWFAWLDDKNEDYLILAVNYLIEKGGLKIDDRGQRASLKEHIDNYNQRIFPHSFYDDEKKEKLIKKMKAALNQRENRSKLKSKHKKAYSFVMDNSIQGKLKRLAGDRPINETLEDLINNTEAFRQAIKAELTESIKPPKHRLSSLTQDNKDQQNMARLQLIKAAQEEIINDSLMRLCEFEFLIEKMQITPFFLAKDRTDIKAKYEDAKKEINQKIKGKLGLLKFALKMNQIDILGDNSVIKEDNN